MNRLVLDLPSFPTRPLTEAVIRVLEAFKTNQPRDPFTYHMASTQIDRLLLVDMYPMSCFYEVGVRRLHRSVIVFARAYELVDEVTQELLDRVAECQLGDTVKSRLRQLIVEFMHSF